MALVLKYTREKRDTRWLIEYFPTQGTTENDPIVQEVERVKLEDQQRFDAGPPPDNDPDDTDYGVYDEAGSAEEEQAPSNVHFPSTTPSPKASDANVRKMIAEKRKQFGKAGRRGGEWDEDWRPGPGAGPGAFIGKPSYSCRIIR